MTTRRTAPPNVCSVAQKVGCEKAAQARVELIDGAICDCPYQHDELRNGANDLLAETFGRPSRIVRILAIERPACCTVQSTTALATSSLPAYSTSRQRSLYCDTMASAIESDSIIRLRGRRRQITTVLFAGTARPNAAREVPMWLVSLAVKVTPHFRTTRISWLHTSWAPTIQGQ